MFEKKKRFTRFGIFVGLIRRGTFTESLTLDFGAEVVQIPATATVDTLDTFSLDGIEVPFCLLLGPTRSRVRSEIANVIYEQSKLKHRKPFFNIKR